MEEVDSGHVLVSVGSHIGSFIYRSVDGGVTWTQQIRLAGSAFARTPEGHSLLANTGYAAMHRSTDNGYTWEQVGMPFRSTDDIVVNDSGHVFVAGWGFSRSRDGGATWQGMGVSGNVRSLAVDGEGRVYAGNRDEYASNSGVYRSDDNGDTWTGMGNPGTVAGFSDNSIGQIFAATTSFGNGIHRSTNFAATWEKVNSGIPTNDTRSIAVGRVRIAVYDLRGRLAGTAPDRVLEAGRHHVPWDASHLPGGVHVHRLEAGGVLVARTFVLLR